jgi:hypothetical protein
LSFWISDRPPVSAIALSNSRFDSSSSPWAVRA